MSESDISFFNAYGRNAGRGGQPLKRYASVYRRAGSDAERQAAAGDRDSPVKR